MKRSFQTVVSQLVFVCLLYGCSDNTTSTSQFQDVVSPLVTGPAEIPPVSGAVAVEMYRSSRLTSLFSEAFTVIVHPKEADASEEIVRSEEVGRIELGVFTGTISLTIVFRDDDFEAAILSPLLVPRLTLRSYFDIPLEDLELIDDVYVLRVPIENDFNKLERVSSNRQVTVESDMVSEFDGPLDRGIFAKLQPTEESRTSGCFSLVDGQAVDNTVRVYESQLQDDDNVSYLSFVSESAMAVLRSYGFELDLSPDDEPAIRIEANILPAGMLVSATNFPLLLPDGSDRDANATAIEIYGERKGISYRLSEEVSVSHSGAGLISRILPCSAPEFLVFPANLRVAAEFPVDDYIVQHRQRSRIRPALEAQAESISHFFNSISHECVLTERMAELPSELIVVPPGMSYTALEYDTGSRRVSWSNMAADKIENQTLRVQSRSSSFLAQSIWTIRIGDNRSSLALPSIPQEVVDEFDVRLPSPGIVGNSQAFIIFRDDPELYITISGYDYSRPLVEPILFDFEQSFPEARSQSCNRSATVFLE